MQNDWLRYSCQMNLPGFGKEGQQKLQHARVLVVGAGGLGCPAAQYLAAAGVGRLGIADFDTVSIGNLHRQILFHPGEVGQKKAVVAAGKLQQQNPTIEVIPHAVRISSHNVLELIKDYDVVVDATDNFETRYLLNDACVLSDKLLVYGAIYRYEGQVAVWNLLNEDGTHSPNYRDLFPVIDEVQVPNCAEGGVIPSLAGIIGCMQANEVLKLITNQGDVLKGKVFLLDAQTMLSRIMSLGSVTKTSITSLEETEIVHLVSIEELKHFITLNSIELIDVRNAEERAGFHIGGKHIPLSELESRDDSFEESKHYILYCASGKRSNLAVKQLSKKFPVLRFSSLDGGLKAWKEQEVLTNSVEEHL